MAHAFVSYVRENADQVDRLVLDLYRRGVDTWKIVTFVPDRGGNLLFVKPYEMVFRF